MKSYVIAIKQQPRSIESALRCIRSMPEFNVQMFSAFTPSDKPTKILQSKGIPLERFKEVFSYYDSCCAAFLSHYTLWENCVKDNEEYQIFEHDAVRNSNLPMTIQYDKVISIGRPSYGFYNTPLTLGVNKLTSKSYFPGAHAYRLKPSGAKMLISRSKIDAAPTDIFLSLNRFPWLQEYYPWPVEAKDNFSTIQKLAGCEAKHGWQGGLAYEILR